MLPMTCFPTPGLALPRKKCPKELGGLGAVCLMEGGVRELPGGVQVRLTYKHPPVRNPEDTAEVKGWESPGQSTAEQAGVCPEAGAVLCRGWSVAEVTSQGPYLLHWRIGPETRPSPPPSLSCSLRLNRSEGKSLFDFNLNAGHWRLHFPRKMSAVA